MKTYHLFQIRPSDEQQAHIDAGDRAMRTTLMKASLGQIDEALAKELYRHTAILHASDEDTLFQNVRAIGAPNLAERDEAFQAVDRPTEAGVGDIVVDLADGDAWMCASYGWENLSWDRCAKLMQYAQIMDVAARADVIPPRVQESEPEVAF